jgi:predicted secreted protein
MADPVLAKDVIIQFSNGSDYFTYGCASDLELQYTMETKSVKTINDGNWDRKRGQKKSYKINLSGLIVDSDVPGAFDLLNYFKNMTDILFRVLFYDETGLIKTIEGYALPTEINLSSGSEGHATGSIVLEGSGDPDNPYTPASPGSPGSPGTPTPVCVATITNGHYTGGITQSFTVDTMLSGSATISRWDYSIDGGPTQSAFTSGAIPASWNIKVSGVVGSSHSITVTPICDNGYSGTPYTLNFTKSL